MRDEKAVKLLNKACWSSSGWKSKLDLTKDEKEYLRTAGLVREKFQLTHDELVEWAMRARKKVTRQEVCRAFVASLGTRYLEYRSALGSYAHLHLLKRHSHQTTRELPPLECDICGANSTCTVTEKEFVTLNFERYKWGGVRHPDLYFAACDLEMFAQLPESKPTEDDWAALQAILDLATDPVQGRSVSKLKKGIKGIIKTNDAEADTLCHILSYAGILATEAYPGFDSKFITYDDRAAFNGDNDQEYPLSCWKGPGIQAKAVQYWFPELSRDS